MPRSLTLEESLAEDPALTPIAKIKEKYALTDQEVKRLRGKIHVDSLDDRRLERFTENLRAANKSQEVQQ